MLQETYISLRNITKSFGNVVANDDISFDIKKGEILALLGENGSGKSTVVNMLSGIYTPDSGQIFMNGKEVKFHLPKDAINAGIGMVHQHFKLVDVMSAADNIIMGDKKGVLSGRKKLQKKVAKLEEKYSLGVVPNKKIYEMSVSEKQNVEILKVLYRGADLLILDEPTAVLTPQESDSLFKILKSMQKKGCSIIIITHKLSEVMEISDRVAVLRKGKFIDVVDTCNTTPQILTELMVGEPISLEIQRKKTTPSKSPLLSVKGVTKTSHDGGKILDDFSFNLHGGEILGVAGIAGSGQKEICEIIAGLDKASSGSVKFQQEEILGLTPRSIIKKGISMSFIPEDRLGVGLVAGMNITNNILLKSYNYNFGPFLDQKFGRAMAEDIVEKFHISTPSVNHQVKKLSGGNIQKVLLGREISLNPKILITAYPVRGLDIGASYHIYDVLNEQKAKGVGVLFIGEDLDVLMGISDKIMVIHHGKVMGILTPEEYKKDTIGLMMMGCLKEEALNDKNS